MVLQQEVGWEHALLLSESHYPIASVDVLASHLGQQRNLSLVHADSTFATGVNHYALHVECDHHYYNMMRTSSGATVAFSIPPHPQLHMASGSNYWVLARDFVRNLITGLKDEGSMWEVLYRHLLRMPRAEERLMQTALLSSSFCDRVALTHDMTVTGGGGRTTYQPSDSDCMFSRPSPLGPKDFATLMRCLKRCLINIWYRP